MLQRDGARRLSPLFDLAIGLSAGIYAICTLLMIPALAQIDLAKMNAKMLTSGPMLFLLGLETIYMGIALVLMVAYLAWYSTLIDWARGRGVVLPSSGLALVCWFVPFVNLVHPAATLLKIQRGTAVRTPIGWWWGLFLLSLVLSTVGTQRLLHGGYDAIFIIGSVLEVVAVLLCWRIVRDFRLADQAWDPRAAGAKRDAVPSSERQHE